MEYKRELALATVATLISAALFYFSFGLHPLWWAAWLAPLPILLLATRTRHTTISTAAFLSASFGATNTWHYLHRWIGLPLFICVLSVVGPGLIFAACTMLFRKFALRGHSFSAALIIPAAWVTAEFLLENWSPNATYGNLAYSQGDNLTLLQVTSLTGIWGVSDAVMFLPAAIAAALAAQTRRPHRILIAASITYLAVFGFGYARLHQSIPHTTARVALLSNDTPATLFPHSEGGALATTRAYAAQIEALSPEHPAIIVLPEKIFSGTTQTIAQTDQILSATALRQRGYLIYGVDHGDPNHTFNESRLFSPDGNLIATYTKHHLVPHLEDVDTPGTSRTNLSLPALGPIGLTICKDMHFPRLSREYGRDGAALLLVPAWDFDIDRWYMSRMSIIRSIESGFSMARASKQGVLSVNDAHGRILAERNTAPNGFTTLVADVPIEHIPTLYARFGDWFAWTDIALFVILIAASRRPATLPTTRATSA